jgi:2-polyprenyl-3-methyl-5-hydroxy-6-metoxy-1,4-benzoquinol methylase
MKEHWDERYSAETYIYGTHPNAWFAAKLDGLTPGKLLLPAEGEGRNAVYAATKGWDVTAFDQSVEGRKKALKLMADKGVNIEYNIHDLTEFDSKKEHFDAIALIFVHMPVEIRTTVHQKLLKSLKPGGYMILEAFTKSQIKNNTGGPRTEELLYECEQIKQDFLSLELIERAELTVHLDEGPLHQGEANVIRLFAKKSSIN